MRLCRCGSCWAFSATAAIESAYHIATRTNASADPLNLSEQHLTSCVNAANGHYSQGCNGGGSDDAINYVFKFNQTMERAYPYTSGNGVTGACDAALISGAASGSFVKLGGAPVYVTKNSQKALMDAVDKQPVVRPLCLCPGSYKAMVCHHVLNSSSECIGTGLAFE